MQIKTQDVLINLEIKKEDNFYEMIATDAKTGEKIGFVNFSIKFARSRVVWLQKIFVEQDKQNKGFGKALLFAFEKFCVDKRAEYIEGKYYPENETAVHFYKNNGYKIEIDGYDKLIGKTLNKTQVEENYKKIEVKEEKKQEDIAEL